MAFTKLFDVVNVLLQLSYPNERLDTDALAKFIGVPYYELSPTMFDLSLAGLVNFRHDSGYWSLERPLNEVSLLDICEALGHTDFITISMQCALREYLIEHEPPARIAEFRSMMRYFILGRLERITLEDLKSNGENRSIYGN